jgi:2,3-bisphosphoglycerate-independent phosphoglycerate mutase
MKYVVLIGDGMADNPIAELGGRTPLEIAEITYMDRLASKGVTGMVRTIPHGMAAGTDVAVLNIFGYDPQKYFSGRSPLEAAGVGIALKDGDISFRCNMISLSDEGEYKEKKLLSHNGGEIDGESADILLEALTTDKEFSSLSAENNMIYYPSSSFRHLAIKSKGCTNGLITKPPHDYLGDEIAKHLPVGGSFFSELNALMERAHYILNEHPINKKRREKGLLPANGIWFWAEGRIMQLPAMRELFQKKGITVSAVPSVWGIAKLAGLDTPRVQGATGDLNTNYEGKAEAVLRGLANGCDFAIVHIEAPDECTHNGDTDGKIEAIKRIDQRCLRHILQGLDASKEAYRILILSDHKTLTSTRGHHDDPVPYIIYDSRVDSKNGRAYTEAECAHGELLENGYELIGRLFGG